MAGMLELDIKDGIFSLEKGSNMESNSGREDSLCTGSELGERLAFLYRKPKKANVAGTELGRGGL